jgi:hypothetical protein
VVASKYFHSGGRILKSFLIALFLCLFISSVSKAQNSSDRYASWNEIKSSYKTYKNKKEIKVTKRYPQKRERVKRQKAERSPFLVRRHAPERFATLAQGAAREVRRAAATIIGGRPQGCPHRFCGCALARHIFGRDVRHLWLAANWLRFPSAVAAPGMVAARRGHVFKLLAHVGGSTWRVWDANSGRGRIRIHNRSIAGYRIVSPSPS